MNKCLNWVAFYLAVGLIGGAATRLEGFQGQASLISAHSHAFSLGFIFFLVVLSLEKNLKLSEVKNFDKWLVFHNVSFIFMLVTLVGRGVLDVLGTDIIGFSYIAGLSHTMLGASLVWFIIILKKAIK